MIVPLSPIFSANFVYAGGQPKSKALALINLVYHDLGALVSHRRAGQMLPGLHPMRERTCVRNTSIPLPIASLRSVAGLQRC
jgi:hypothetical protein